MPSSIFLSRFSISQCWHGLVVVLLLICPALHAQTSPDALDVATWWDSPGEQASLAVIQRHAEAAGLHWKQRIEPGSGTSRYGNVLRSWVDDGNPPVASHVIGYDIQHWAQHGKLAILDDVAAAGEWDEVVPFGIQHLSKYQGHWVAAPFNAHSTNWLWVNAAVLEQLGENTAPDSWPDLVRLLQSARDAGITPLAVGREHWEYTLLFESVAAGLGGAEFYRRAFLELDPAALDEGVSEEIFRRMRILSNFVDPDYPANIWNEATNRVRSGQALLQVQGSWVDGEFALAGLQPSKDYHCWRFPDTQGIFLFNADQYMFFRDAPVSPQVRQRFARVLMEPVLQTELNLKTGAAPARVDVPRQNFNACGRQAISDMRRSNLQRTMMGSIAMGNANPPAVKEAIYQLVAEHFHHQIDDREAAHRLRNAIGAHP